MKDATYLKRIQIKIDEDGAGLFHATSPDLEGFLVSERTMVRIPTKPAGDSDLKPVAVPT